jgi:LmbE family N-acetylglucosaminyl deacetylase
MRAGEAHAAMRALPLGGLDSIVGSGTVLILAPHADDESLGCGGLIAECCARGRPPWVLILTDGVGSHPNSRAYPAARLRATREAEARQAVAELGLPADRIGFLALPDTAAPRAGPVFEWAVATIASRAQEAGCTSIAASWRHDPHCDHLAAHCIAVAVAQAAALRHIAYPVWGWTLPEDEMVDGDIWGFRLDVARHLPAKRRAIAAHRSQIGGLIVDDPSGFHLPPHFLSMFDGAYEVFLVERSFHE